MRNNKLILVIIAGVLGVGCSDEGGFLAPESENLSPGRSTAELHTLQHAVLALPMASYDGVPGRGDDDDHDKSKLATLEAYEGSFWAVRGERRRLKLYYGNEREYLRITVPEDALGRRPDGTLFAEGDSVLITVKVDSSLLTVELEPSDLMFNPVEPAELRISYAGANLDFNGDGVVDGKDARIEQQRLTMWVQQGKGRPWFPQNVQHDLRNKRFTTWLFHFSNYAVSW